MQNDLSLLGMSTLRMHACRFLSAQQDALMKGSCIKELEAACAMAYMESAALQHDNILYAQMQKWYSRHAPPAQHRAAKYTSFRHAHTLQWKFIEWRPQIRAGMQLPVRSPALEGVLQDDKLSMQRDGIFRQS